MKRDEKSSLFSFNCEQGSQLMTRAYRPRLAGDASVGRREASLNSAHGVFAEAKLRQKRIYILLEEAKGVKI